MSIREPDKKRSYIPTERNTAKGPVVDIELEYTNAPVCPHCGHAEMNAWEIDFGVGIEGTASIGCGSCGKDYECSRTVTVYYTSAKGGE